MLHSEETIDVRFAFKLVVLLVGGMAMMVELEPGIVLYMALGVLAFIAWRLVANAWAHFQQAPTDAGSGSEEDPFCGDEELAALVAEHENADE